MVHWLLIWQKSRLVILLIWSLLWTYLDWKTRHAEVENWYKVFLFFLEIKLKFVVFLRGLRILKRSLMSLLSWVMNMRKCSSIASHCTALHQLDVKLVGVYLVQKYLIFIELWFTHVWRQQHLSLQSAEQFSVCGVCCVRACVRACVLCVRACVARACVCVCVCVFVLHACVRVVQHYSILLMYYAFILYIRDSRETLAGVIFERERSSLCDECLCTKVCFKSGVIWSVFSL